MRVSREHLIEIEQPWSSKGLSYGPKTSTHHRSLEEKDAASLEFIDKQKFSTKAKYR